MDNEINIRDFYKEEEEYEKSIIEAKTIIRKVIKINLQELDNKIKYVDPKGEYGDFVDLYEATIGRKTNKFYYCDTQEDIKYYGLTLGKLYRISEIHPDLQKKFIGGQTLDLKVRSIIAKIMLEMSQELKELFNKNIDKGDGLISTIDSRFITESDIEILDNFIKYLKILMTESGRLKILVAEKEIYLYEQAKEEYNKKSKFERMFYKMFNQEKKVINNMAKNKK